VRAVRLRTSRAPQSTRTGKQGSFRKPSSTTRETHLPATVTDGRGVHPSSAVATRRPRLPMRFRLRSDTRRSRWFTPRTLLPCSRGIRTLSALGDVARDVSSVGIFQRRSPPVEESILSLPPHAAHGSGCVSGYAVSHVARDGRSSPRVPPAWIRALSAHGKPRVERKEKRKRKIE
jgi:hypothetical protein